MEIVGDTVRRELVFTERDSFVIPYGTYNVQCWNGNAYTPRRLVTIRQRQIDIVCVLLPREHQDTGLDLPWVINGVVRPPPQPGKVILARLLSLYSHVVEEAIVGEDGAFSITVRSMSPYKLWILSGGKLLTEKDVVIDYLSPRPMPTITIDLPKKRD
jgi:hypothetical protein